MTCPACSFSIGDLITIKTEMPICSDCNSLITGQYPRDAIYIGKIDQQHWFKLIKPYKCQSCGSTIKGCSTYCEDEGEVINLGILVEYGSMNDFR